jgi:hypothetical protein
MCVFSVLSIRKVHGYESSVTTSSYTKEEPKPRSDSGVISYYDCCYHELMYSLFLTKPVIR